MAFEAHLRVIGDDDSRAWPVEHLSDLTIEQVSPGLLKATSNGEYADGEEFRACVKSLLPALASRCVWTRMGALSFDINDVKEAKPGIVTIHVSDTIAIGDGRDLIGLKPMNPSQWDMCAVRDEIIRSELAGGDRGIAAKLEANATLLHSVESFIRSILQPENTMAHLYKAVEVIQHHVGGRKELSQIGLSKSYVDYIMSRANRSELDQRHAPVDAATVEAIPEEERRECIERTREVVRKFANSLK